MVASLVCVQPSYIANKGGRESIRLDRWKSAAGGQGALKKGSCMCATAGRSVTNRRREEGRGGREGSLAGVDVIFTPISFYARYSLTKGATITHTQTMGSLKGVYNY